MANKLFNGLLAKFKAQYVPVRDSHLGIYLPTGAIAKAVKPEEKGADVTEYRVFINNELTTVPAAMVTTKFPVFRISKPVNQVVAGDIIRTGDDKKYTYRRVTRVLTDGRIESDSFGGATSSKTVAINDLLLGSKTVSVAVNLFSGINLGNTTNMFQNPMLFALLNDDDNFGDDDSALSTIFLAQAMNNGNTAGNPMANILPYLLMKDGSDNSIATIAMMQACTGNAGAAGMQGILPFLLLKDGNNGDMLETAMMMSFIGGNGSNPFANLFGTTPAVAPTTAPAAAPAAEVQA